MPPPLSSVVEVAAMGVVEDLARARATFEGGDWVAAFETWSRLPAEEVTPTDLQNLATAAFLVGRREEAVAALHRAYQDRLGAGDPLGAARPALWLGLLMGMLGESAVSAGWSARAERALDEHGRDVVEHGYAQVLRFFRAVGTGEWDSAAEHAAAISDVGRRFADPDLVAFGLHATGRLRMTAGAVQEGLGLLDEAMVGVASGEVSPVFAGAVYCSMVEACQEVGDLGRAAEWTAALSTWCERQPGLVPFTGQCAVHRGQILRLHGAWDEALEEFGLALERYDRAGLETASAFALSERGDLLRLRGDLAAAEADLHLARERGYEPQPSLVLLWLARGRLEAALSGTRRLLSEGTDPVHRVRLLPAAVTVLLTGGDLQAARALATELDEAARAFGCRALLASAAQTAGLVALHEGDPAGALPYLRRSLQTWVDLGARYEQARTRAMIGRGLAALGDTDSGQAELQLAHDVFAQLGAGPDVREVGTRLSPMAAPGGLSLREVEVLRLVATGLSNRRIAAELVLSEKTVARHLSNIFTKLGVTSRTAAAAFAFEHGLATRPAGSGEPPAT